MQIWHYVAACSPMKKLQRQESNCSASIIIASPFMASRCGMHCICTACTIHISRISTAELPSLPHLREISRVFSF